MKEVKKNQWNEKGATGGCVGDIILDVEGMDYEKILVWEL